MNSTGAHSANSTQGVDNPGVFAVRQSLAGSIAANSRWGRLGKGERSEATAPGRTAAEQRFLDEADGDPVRAENLRKAHFQRMALKSAEVRRRKRQLRSAQAELKSGIEQLGELADHPDLARAREEFDELNGGAA